MEGGESFAGHYGPRARWQGMVNKLDSGFLRLPEQISFNFGLKQQKLLQSQLGKAEVQNQDASRASSFWRL